MKTAKKNQKQYSGPIDELRNTNLFLEENEKIPTFKEIAIKTGVAEDTVISYNQGRAWNYMWVYRLISVYRELGVSWERMEEIYLRHEPLFEARSRLRRH